MSETTTDAATQDTGVTPDVTQPDEQPAEAVTTPVSEPTTAQEDEPTTDVDNSTVDEDSFDFNAWLEKKGIDPSTPEGKEQIAKSWRAMEKKMHQSTQKASELEKAALEAPLEVDTDNELVRQALQKADAAETTLKIQQWKQQNGITQEQDEAIGQYVTDNPNVGYLYRNGHLTLDQLYAMSGVGTTDASAAKAQGAQEALEKLANKQRAATPTGAATSASTPTSVDPILAALRSDD